MGAQVVKIMLLLWGALLCSRAGSNQAHAFLFHQLQPLSSTTYLHRNSSGPTTSLQSGSADYQRLHPRQQQQQQQQQLQLPYNFLIGSSNSLPPIRAQQRDEQETLQGYYGRAQADQEPTVNSNANANTNAIAGPNANWNANANANQNANTNTNPNPSAHANANADATATDYELKSSQSANPLCPAECHCNATAQIADCSNRNLVRVPSSFPRDTKRIKLERNNITELGAFAFQGLKRLQRIDLSNNNLVKIDPLAFAGGLQSLSSLILYGNRLTRLPSGLFNELSQLTLLLLNANSLSCIQRDLFQPLTNLNLLSLYNNNLETLANGTFDGLRNIKTIHLGKNPLNCDCHLLWLADYLRSNPKYETSEAKCESPARNANQKLSELSKQKFWCEANEVGRPVGQCGQPAPAGVGQAGSAPPAPPAGADQSCPAGCVCNGSTVDCSRVSRTESRVSPAGTYELPDIPDDIPVYVTRLRMNDSRIKRIRQTGLFRRLANSQKLLQAGSASPQQHARVMNSLEQYCSNHKRKLSADRLQQNRLDNDLVANVCVLMGF